jgi:hypothetical protein
MKISIITRSNKLEMRMGRLVLGVHILYAFYCKMKLEKKSLKFVLMYLMKYACVYVFMKEGCLLVLVVEISKTITPLVALLVPLESLP